MLLGTKPDTKELIISLLVDGSIDSLELQKRVQTQKSVTKQGFYKALRELVKEEVVVKNKQLVALNNFWVNKMHSFVTLIDKTYQNDDSFIGLEEDESLVYHFKNLTSLDVLWMHYFYIIAKKEPTEPIIFYNAHEFWSLFRHNEEAAMYEWVNTQKRTAYEIIGANTELDRSTTSYIKNHGIETAYEPVMSFAKNYSTAVIGDYMLDTILDMNTATAIDNLYKTHKTLDEAVSKELSTILSHLKRSKVVISRNKKKAEMLRKRFMKYFVFYKPSKE